MLTVYALRSLVSAISPLDVLHRPPCLSVFQSPLSAIACSELCSLDGALSRSSTVRSKNGVLPQLSAALIPRHRNINRTSRSLWLQLCSCLIVSGNLAPEGRLLQRVRHVHGACRRLRISELGYVEIVRSCPRPTPSDYSSG